MRIGIIVQRVGVNSGHRTNDLTVGRGANDSGTRTDYGRLDNFNCFPYYQYRFMSPEPGPQGGRAASQYELPLD